MTEEEAKNEVKLKCAALDGSAFPNYVLSVSGEAVIIEYYPFLGQHFHLAIALCSGLATLAPFPAEPANEEVRRDDAVTWDVWCEWIVPKGSTDC
jgi:hypothetical protein